MIAGKSYYFHNDMHIHICPICKEGDMSYVECRMKEGHVAEVCAQCLGQEFIFCLICRKAQKYNGPSYDRENNWAEKPCKECEAEYTKEWQPFIEKNGVLDSILVRRELHDYKMIRDKIKSSTQGTTITHA